MRKSINTPTENIQAWNIKAWDIEAHNINAWNIEALTITLRDGCNIMCDSLKCTNRQELINAGKVIFK